MIYHHTKSKGDLGVLKAKLDLYLQGFLILSPETEHAPFDLVIYKDGVFKSVQVKYRNLNRNGVLQIPFRSSYSTSKGVITKMVDKANIDIYAVYCPQTDSCYYFDPKHFNRCISLRVKTSLNNQQQGIRLADDFKKVP
ncbi:MULTISPECIES: group I intron-associated PD-(D/E)XK endonuclease [Niastella]|uniref:group I intron-associated PD-(D/E)XK endonuclease n=1 Tax=Niastella TaxID=354354 RepID=UPI003612BCE5